MSNNTIEIETTSQQASIALAKTIASHLKGGEVLELISDLGGGKTTFTKGLALGLNSKDRVSSPTFTIENIYEGDKLKLHHLDFYRLNDAGILRDMVSEVLSSKTDVLVIEWAEIIEDVLPAKRLVINILATGENTRKIKLTYPDELNYLMEDVK